MKYKVGDKVRVRKDLKVYSSYGYDAFVKGMEKYLGKTMTIDKITNNKYKLKEDTNQWNWTDEMLEDVEGIDIITNGNKVIAKRGNKVGIAKCSPEDEFDIFTGARLAIDRLEKECNPYDWLKEGVMYYFPCFGIDGLYGHYPYHNDEVDRKYISCGIVFKTKEEAINCAKKMLEVVK